MAAQSGLMAGQPEKPIPQIRRALMRLEKGLEVMQDRIEQIETRLETVLMPAVTLQPIHEEIEKPVIMSVLLAREINEQAERAEALAARLNFLTDRIEI